MTRIATDGQASAKAGINTHVDLELACQLTSVENYCTNIINFRFTQTAWESTDLTGFLYIPLTFPLG
jgi:hypothetical protein